MKRADLLSALEIVKPGLANREIIEQATSFAFIDGCVVTYNDNVSIRCPVEGLKISGAIKAEELYKLLGKLKQDDITVESNGPEVILTSGRAKAGFTLQQQIKLPLEEIKNKTEWKPLPKDFRKALEFTMTTCSRDQTRAILTCINVTPEGRLQSTDNFRISIFNLDKVPANEFLLPAESAQIVSGYGLGWVAEGRGWIHFKSEGGLIEFSCRVVKGEYPPIYKAAEGEGTKVELPSTMQDVLSKASVFCTQEQVLDQRVKVVISEKRLKLRADGETGWFEEEVNMAYRGEPITFSINPHLLQSILDQTRICQIGEKTLKFIGDRWQFIACLM